MKIAIGSENQAKNKAVKDVFDKLYENVEYIPLKTDSKIREQPLSDNEAITGAINRAKEAIKVSDADFGIGLEGTVNTNKHGMFLSGWVAIIDKSGTTGIGSSGHILIPKQIEERINNGEELGPIIHELAKDDTIRQTVGTGGILTKNLLTRDGEFREAIKSALAIFRSPEYY
ncbi:DUF84 family protein [Candidatus Woesearchaeota archaeon]|nr:DUF84 family protein [Candidatus Woesearchaeota archaeon]